VKLSSYALIAWLSNFLASLSDFYFVLLYEFSTSNFALLLSNCWSFGSNTIWGKKTLVSERYKPPLSWNSHGKVQARTNHLGGFTKYNCKWGRAKTQEIKECKHKESQIKNLKHFNCCICLYFNFTFKIVK